MAFFLGTNLDVPVRRELEKRLVTYYHQKLLDLGVGGYSFEQCWYDYRFNLWRPFLSFLAVCPSIAKQKRRRTGIFAPSPTNADAKQKLMCAATEECDRHVTAM